MRRIVQSVKDGTLIFEEGPMPSIEPSQVLVATGASLISSGTERALRDLASSSLVSKARARPDLVRQVLKRAETDGLKATVEAVRSRLSETMPLGYSAAGVVVAVGETVSGVRPGQRVATAGAGHGDLQVVAGRLTAVLADDVSYEEASFGTVGSVALNGLRLAGITAGDKVAVVGLGLVGQLSCRLAIAMGAFVAGTDLDDWKIERAAKADVHTFQSDPAGWESLLSWTGGVGCDAVLVTAATKSSEPMNAATKAVRDQGTVILVGDAGLDLDRRSLYENEVTVRVARAYGPGRYDPMYEAVGVDYPVGHARWTAGRNLQAVVDLIGSRRLEVGDLITQRFPFEAATEAYEFLHESSERSLGIVLTYDSDQALPSPVVMPTSSVFAPPHLSVGLIGAGHFAREILVPAARAAGFGPLVAVASAGGSSAQRMADAQGFRRAASDAKDVISDPSLATVFIASRHDSHAEYVVAALAAGKHVFCEKPLALTEEELDSVENTWRASGATLMVGFNRRWSPAIRAAKHYLGDGPLQIMYRVNAGALPADHWLKDRRQGGRLLGEASHFIDTCNALVRGTPVRVYASDLGRDELILDENFTITLSYANGSQATIVYSAMAPTAAGKESVEILAAGRAVRIEDFHTLRLWGSGKARKLGYKPADKGHAHEFEVFAEAIRGQGDPTRIAGFAFDTSRVALAAVRSLTTGAAVEV